MKDIIIKIIKNIFCILLVIILPFSFPLVARFFIHIHLYVDLDEFKNYIEIFCNKNFLMILIPSAILVYITVCNKNKLKEWLQTRDFSLKFKDAELTSKMAELINESTKKKNFISNLNAKEDNKLVTQGVQEELQLGKKGENKPVYKYKYEDEYRILENENDKLRFFSAYNIINQKTKELLHIIYCDKNMELETFKNVIIKSFKNRNRKNKNLSIAQKNEYANNKYETIKDGLQFLNIIEISDDNKTVTLTSYGETFVKEYIEKEVGENE